METLELSPSVTEPQPVRAYRYNIPEVQVRTVSEGTIAKEMRMMSRPELAAQFFREVVTKADWFDAEKECVVVLLLNRKNVLKSWSLISLGTATASLMHPRETMRAAIVASAAAIVIMHNHPSGDPAPSSADVQVTRLMREAAKTIEIALLDHVVVGDSASDPTGLGYYSFRSAGMI